MDIHNATFCIGDLTERTPDEAEVLKGLESSNVEEKIFAMKDALHLLMSGTKVPRMLMQVIRFCINEENHELKKLIMLYFEICLKKDESGEPLREMLLVCNAFRNYLTHPNEFLKGSALRFLHNFKEKELLEPLVPSITASLDHTHDVVRRNAVLTIHHVYGMFKGELIPDAPQIVLKFLESEADPVASRNGLLFLRDCAPDIAIEYCLSVEENIINSGEGFQLIWMDVARRACRKDPTLKARFVPVVFKILRAESASAAFEAALTLYALSSSPTAVKAVAERYVQLINTESDTNIKLVVLERLEAIKSKHVGVLREVLLELLRSLDCPHLEIRKQILNLAQELVDSSSVEAVMAVLKKSALSLDLEESAEGDVEYRAVLLKSIHTITTRFPFVAAGLLDLLLKFASSTSGVIVMTFVRMVAFQQPKLRPLITEQLRLVLPKLAQLRSLRIAFWVLGEYSQDDSDLLIGIPAVIAAGKKALSQLFVNPVVKPTDKNKKTDGAENMLFTISALAVTLVKMVLRLKGSRGASSNTLKAAQVDALLLLLEVAEFVDKKEKEGEFIDSHSLSRILRCIHMLMGTSDAIPEMFERCELPFGEIVEKSKAQLVSEPVAVVVPPEAQINFRQLRKRTGGTEDTALDEDVSLAVLDSGESDQLTHVHQLTGFGDPLYAEALVRINEYDVGLEISVFNPTGATVTNITLEMAATGELKLGDRPEEFTLGPHDTYKTNVSIKLTSTETGHVFGTLCYTPPKQTESEVINLKDIPVDVLDFLRPCDCSGLDFRRMWASFEWENLVKISTNVRNCAEFLEHIQAITNMKCLTPSPVVSFGDRMFVVANMYARSVFGEDAVMNVSFANDDDGRLEGHVRIRSKMQGIALSLGDRISAQQTQ